MNFFPKNYSRKNNNQIYENFKIKIKKKKKKKKLTKKNYKFTAAG